VAYDVVIMPGRVRGNVTLPPSKSLLHRALFCAAFAPGISTVGPRHDCGDIRDTLKVLKALGASIETTHDAYRITGISNYKDTVTLSIDASATTLRLLIPVLAATRTAATISLGPSLANRPITSYEHLFGSGVKKHGASVIIDAALPPGNLVLGQLESSQVLSGLLVAFAIVRSTATIHVESLPSAAYVTLTASVLDIAGVRVVQEGGVYRLQSGEHLRPFKVDVEGDASHASLWLACGVLGGPLSVKGLRDTSLQADAIFPALLASIKANITYENGLITAFPGRVQSFRLSVDAHPDLAFALALVALHADGPCVLSDVHRLRIKESDRVEAIAASLRALGVDVQQGQKTMTIHPMSSLRGDVCLEANDDHRLAMMLALCAPLLNAPIVIRGADAVEKSYPDFFTQCRALGLTLTQQKGR